MRTSIHISCLLIAYAAATASGEEASPSDPPLDEIKAAIKRSITAVEKSTAEYRRQRQCFSCHHQALPVLMLTEAKRRGFAVVTADLEQQLDHTAAHLKRGLDNYRNGHGQGGKADTAGWALWTLETGGRSGDEVTSAVAQYLVGWHKDDGHWKAAGRRPPTEASAYTTTYVALRGLNAFGADDQSTAIAERREKAVKWLIESKPGDTEDRVFRLRSLHYVDADDAAIKAAADELLATQRDDGGWAQTAELSSDAYATGTALSALFEVGVLKDSDAAYRKGLRFLVGSQREDGSWHIATRSKPIQEYFESGFPHGKDQFISIAATCWSAHAMLLACPSVEH